MLAFRHVLSKNTSSQHTGAARPNASAGLCASSPPGPLAVNSAVSFSLMTRRSASLLQRANRSLVLLANTLTASSSPTCRNHCNSGLSASRTQNSRWASPVSPRAMLARNANTLHRAKRAKRFALIADASILCSTAARLTNSCSKPEPDRIASMRSNMSRCSR